MEVVCDYCKKAIEYDTVSCYAETTYLKRIPNYEAGDGWVKGVKPVARQRDVGYGKFAIVCSDCDRVEK